MTTGKKAALVLAALAMLFVALLGLEQLQARREFRSALDLPDPMRAQVTIIRSSDRAALDNEEHNSLKTEQVKRLFASLKEEARFAGIGSGKDPSLCDYELILTAPNGYFRIFHLAKDIQYQYCYSNDLSGSAPTLKLKETPNTLALLEDYFK